MLPPKDKKLSFPHTRMLLHGVAILWLKNHSGQELLRQPVKQIIGAFADACMHGRWLNDGAARRNKPVETFPLRELGDWARAGFARADAGDCFKVLVEQPASACGHRTFSRSVFRWMRAAK